MEQCSERNPYADHLVEVNKYNSVLTTRDICNNKGATVVPRGTYLTEEVANKIARFTLDMPLELQVSLASTLSPSELFDGIQKAQAGILGANDRIDLTKELVKQCGLIHAYPLLSQKLTVFSERMSARFMSTQSATAFAVLIAIEMGLDDETMEVVFTATQMHDAGFLNINPDMASIFDRLPDAERRQISIQHLSLGTEFLDQVPSLSKRVGRAVLEHQERKDGSGWPQGIIGDKHSLEAQIIGLAVMLNDSYRKKLKPRGYGPVHLIPLAQAESEAIDRDIYHAVVTMLRQNTHGHSQVIPLEFMPQLALYLRVMQRFMVHWLALAKDCANGMRETQDLVQTARSVSIIHSLEELYRNSGLWDAGLRRWLAESAAEKSDFEEVELVALMLESVMDKLKSLQWSMRDAAKLVSSDWISRCDDLASLLYALPKDHFEAFENYACFENV